MENLGPGQRMPGLTGESWRIPSPIHDDLRVLEGMCPLKQQKLTTFHAKMLLSNTKERCDKGCWIAQEECVTTNTSFFATSYSGAKSDC